MTPEFSVVIPTIGRASLQRLLTALQATPQPVPQCVVLVDDRPGDVTPLRIDTTLPVQALRSGGRGPAAARNVGWRAVRTPWVAFVDDDVIPARGWFAALAADLAAADASGAAGSQGVIDVPRPTGRRSTDDERRTEALADAQWITADMAYRRAALVAAGGFDERFPRAYREDADLALRITEAGRQIVPGSRRCTHPVAPATWASSVRAQIGNRDNALMRRKHGPYWRTRVGEGPGRTRGHAATTAAASIALGSMVVRRRKTAAAAAAVWTALTADFTARRFWRGPHTSAELARMLVTSVLIPPVAVAHRLAGEWAFRSARRDPPLAVLLDRDDTIIVDEPYLNDPAGVRPVPGAARALRQLRDRGLLLAVVTNQSGVAKGLISPEQLEAVNARVDAMLGPFDSWQVCVHDAADGCACRKPEPGMVLAAAESLGVDAGRCVLIGDTGGDVNAALAARARAVLVPTDRTLRHEIAEARSRAAVAASLEQAVALVLRECR
ncbi:HAD-IIIA family hydrolase [Mycolicibacterium crocinum]|uniref:D,D-heptose 1,7-bisphosphate phosphatase n=1 Tax=Mycolicibacterium crocinum TaxID=388459 RepID=A0ABY3TUM0_9MYCO|nr:HAD-IIIA family hydrolase [Mycolicibacterium crocinum]ULN43038.1 HAD-IIIA family hydrolase [Mycolicibacterium crocinum]